MLGYKHIKQAIEKIKFKFVNKVYHPMFRKINSQNTKNLLSIKKECKTIRFI